MTAIEMKMSLLQEVMSLDDNEQLIKKARNPVEREQKSVLLQSKNQLYARKRYSEL